MAIPPYTKVVRAESNVSQPVPISFRTDLVLRIQNNGDDVAAIVVEVQIGVDKRKKWSWPVYWAVQRARGRVPTCLLIIALEQHVADWAREPIEDIGGSVRPQVVGPGDIPRVDTVEKATESAESAVFSLAAHWQEPGSERLTFATMEAIERMGASNPKRAAACRGFLSLVIGTNFDKLMERTMNSEIDTAESLWANRWNHLEAKWEAKGVAKGKADTLLRLLAIRFGPPTSEATNALRTATVEQLDRGTDVLLNARSTEDVLRAVRSC